MQLTIQLTPDQITELAVEVSRLIAPKREKLTYSVTETARALGVSKATISRRVSAGLIPRLPGHERVLIPADYIKRLTTTYPARP